MDEIVLVFADAGGRIVEMAGDLRQPTVSGGLELARGLRLREPSAGRLRRAVAAAVEGREPTVLVIGEDDEQRQLVTVRPAREAGLAVISVRPLDAGAAGLEASRLAEMFSLSRSESEIAIALLRGESLVDIAHVRGVQHETVRSQVKSLLRRVGVANQKQLAATLTQVGAAVRSVSRPVAPVPVVRT